MDDETRHQQERLGTYRQNVRYLLDQAAQFGSEVMAPLPVRNQLHEARTRIADLKTWLRAQGVAVADHLDDEPPAQADALRAQATLDTMPVDAVPAVAPFPAFSRMPYSPNPHFVGRDDALLALAQALKGGGRVALGPRAAATGLGGIGKTSVAAEFVHRYGQYFAGGVFWLSFADPEAVAGEVAACGGPGFLDLRPGFGDLNQDAQVALVQAAWREDIPRLLVFDNCEDPKLVEAWAPPTGGCRVLITSRRQRWPSGLRVQTQRLAVLARANSTALLQQLAPRLIVDEADAIAAELGDLPLALHMAGSFLARYEALAISTYLQQLQDQTLLNHPCLQGRGSEFSPTYHDLHVGRIFVLGYSRLDPNSRVDRLARQFLAIMAWLAPGEPIPGDLVLSVPDLAADDLDGTDALLRLNELGLIDAVTTNRFSIHRLVQAFVKSLPFAVTQQNLAEEILAITASQIIQSGYPAAMQPLLAHLRWMTRHHAIRDDETIATLCNNLGYYLYSIGDYAAARPLFERALAIWEDTMGPNHPFTATSLNNIALLLQDMRDYAAARPLFERALAIWEDTMGPVHIDTARSLSNLAVLLQRTRDYNRARPLLERALAIKEQVLGPDHPDTATTLNNLAVLLRETRDYAGALRLYERALAIHEQALGENHPATANSLHNMARLAEATGDYAKARPLYERALAIREQMLGRTHPDTAKTLHSLADLFQNTKDYAAALPLLKQALAIREQTLGEDHPDTRSTFKALAYLLQATGDYNAARMLYEQSLARAEQALGPNHPSIVTKLNSLASFLLTTFDYSRSQQLYERALAICEQTLGEDHLDTAISLDNLAYLLRVNEDYTRARLLYERVLAIRAQVLGPDHPKTMATRKNLTALDAKE